ncbi:MAG: PDZ domain-containing protein [Oscillospiraceae bacterium]|nr:PDZ domain-containing protein [Oscillospiraceae bacterium]
MNKKISLGLCIALMAIASAITFIISTSYSTSLYDELISDVQKRSEMYQKLEQIDTYVRAYYGGTIDEDVLTEALAEGYVSVIESANADYYNKPEYEIYKENLNGTHLGIGVYTEEIGGYPCITQVLADSPAALAGMAVGESIVEINGEAVLTMGYDKAVSMLRSEAGTPLTVTLRAGGVDRTVNVTTLQMTMATVKTNTYGDFGYIKIYQFNDKTYQQFIAAYSMLTTNGVKGFIIDLRNNDGLSFDPATNLLSAILPSDSVVAVTVSSSGEETVFERASGERSPKAPVCVLTNAQTSGPAELFAAALRDNLGASIVGATTKGSSSLLETFALYDGTAIVLPTAQLKASSTLISGGVKPDFEVVIEGDTDEALALLDDTNDSCIKKAIEILASYAQ